jgi:hypothetical protein
VTSRNSNIVVDKSLPPARQGKELSPLNSFTPVIDDDSVRHRKPEENETYRVKEKETCRAKKAPSVH